MIFKDLQYIEGLLGYMKFRCYQILKFPEFKNVPEFTNDCLMCSLRGMHISMLFACLSHTANN